MIIKDRNFNITDIRGKEMPEEGLELFNVVATDEDIQNYPSKQIEPHWHDMFELILIKKGKALVHIGKDTYQVNEGDACYIAPNSLHSLTTIKNYPCRFNSFVIAKSVLTGTGGNIYDMHICKILDSLPLYINISNSNANKAFFENFSEAWQAMELEKQYYEFIVRDAITKIILFINNKTQPNQNKNNINDERFKKALLYIDEHICENISVDEIGKSIYLGKREIQRLFMTYLHISPMAYVRQKKISSSCIDLYEDKISVTEIAYKYGFSSPGHYTKIFKEVIGINPLTYRKTCKN